MASASMGGGLRVGFLVDRWDPSRGGAERALADLARHLQERGYQVLAIAAEHSLGAPGEPVAVVTRGWTRGARARHLARALPAAARAAGCDVTIGLRHLERVDLYWPHDGAHAASLAARREARGRPADAPPRGRHALFAALERRLLEEGGARRVACVSRLVEEELARLYPRSRERLVSVPNGVDLERFHPRNRPAGGPPLRRELELEAGEPLLVFAGADGRRKGLAELLAALGGLRERRWTLLAAGVKHPGAWARLARTHGLDATRVRLASTQEAAALWSAADLCVLPTWRDTCGLVVLEALASGVPVVTSARAGAAEALRERDVGTVLQRPDDVDGLRGALGAWLERLASWDDERRAAARACVLDRDRGAWLDRLEALVLELAPPRAGTRGAQGGGTDGR